MKNNTSSLFIVLLLSSVFSITACSPAGDSKTDPDPDANTNPDPDPDPTPTPTGLSSEKDSSWTIVSNAPSLNKVLYTGSKYYAVGKYGYIAESTDGKAWTQITIDTATSFSDLAVNGNNVVVIPDAKSGLNGVAQITGETSWGIVDGYESKDCKKISSIIFDGSQFVGVFDSTKICTSTDGSAWTLQSTQDLALQKIVATGDKYTVLFAGGLGMLSALDSTAMTVPSLPTSTSGDFSDLMYKNSTYVGIRSGQILYSTDGADWISGAGTNPPSGVSSLAYSATKGFVTLSSVGWVYSSVDGITWTRADNTKQPSLSSRGIGGSLIINGATETLAYANGATYSSNDLLNWSQGAATKIAGKIKIFLSYENTLYAASDSYQLSRSTDNGVSWTKIDLPVSNIISIIHDGSQFIASGEYGIAYSADGISWTKAFDYNRNSMLNASVALGSTTYYFGSYGEVLSSTDGINFQKENAPSPGGNPTGTYKQAVSNGSSSIVVITSTNSIINYNGTDWSTPKSYLDNTLNDVIWTGSSFVIVGEAGTVMTSADGEVWTSYNWLTNANITDVIAVGNTLYATDNMGKIATSTNDGQSWTLEYDFRAYQGSAGVVVSQFAYDGSQLTGFGVVSLSGSSSSITAYPPVGTSTSWTTTLQGFSNNVSASKIIYDTASQSFVSYTQNGTQVLASTDDGASWAFSDVIPSDSAFSYIGALGSISRLGYGPVKFTSGTPNTYVSGFAYSEDGQNWRIRVGQDYYPGYTPSNGVFARIGNMSSGNYFDDFYETGKLQITTDGVSYNQPDWSNSGLDYDPDFHFVKYVNGQYIGVVKALSIDGNNTQMSSIYTSSDASSWTLQSSIVANDQWAGQVSDIEYDGTQYLFVFNDIKLSTPLNSPKGTMIAKSSDLQNFTLNETGIKAPMSDLIISTDGYTLIGENGTIATHAAY